MTELELLGFGDAPIAASAFGNSNDPPLLLLPGSGQSRRVWDDAGRALAAAGRYAVSLDLRAPPGPDAQPYDLDTHVRDLSAILARFSSRPVLVGASLGGWIAMAALGEGEPDLASALVLVDSPPQIDIAAARDHGAITDNIGGDSMTMEQIAERLLAAAGRIRQPALIVRGAQSRLSTPESMAQLAAVMRDPELAEIEGAGHLAAARTLNVCLQQRVLHGHVHQVVALVPLKDQSVLTAETLVRHCHPHAEPRLSRALRVQRGGLRLDGVHQRLQPDWTHRAQHADRRGHGRCFPKRLENAFGSALGVALFQQELPGLRQLLCGAIHLLAASGSCRQPHRQRYAAGWHRRPPHELPAYEHTDQAHTR